MEDIREEITELMKKHSDWFGTGEDLEKNSELVCKILVDKQSPQEAMGINDEILESMYGFAYSLYYSGNYEQGSNAFKMLIQLNPYLPKHYLGLAACLHMAKNFDEAAGNYLMAAYHDKESPLPYYYASDCYLKMDKPAVAWMMLELAKKRMETTHQYDKMKDQLEANLEAVKEKAAITQES